MRQADVVDATEREKAKVDRRKTKQEADKALFDHRALLDALAKTEAAVIRAIQKSDRGRG